MNHHTTAKFWQAYHALDPETQRAADQAFDMIKRDPRHPSLRLKKVGRYWSARVRLGCRAVAVESEDGLLWIWIGLHDPYERQIA